MVVPTRAFLNIVVSKGLFKNSGFSECSIQLSWFQKDPANIVDQKSNDFIVPCMGNLNIVVQKQQWNQTSNKDIDQ